MAGMRLAGVDIAAEEERKRRMALLLQEQNRMQQQQGLNLASQDLFGRDFEGTNEVPLEGATDWIGDGAADLSDKLGLPQESLIALGLITRNGRVTQRGFKALVKRVGGNNVVKPRIKLKNNTTTNTVKPKIKLKNKATANTEAKTTMLQNLMKNMKNNKGRWATGGLVGGSVASNQFSGVDDNNFSPVVDGNSWYNKNVNSSDDYNNYLFKNGDVLPPYDKSTSTDKTIIKNHGPWSYNTGEINPRFGGAIDNSTGEVVSLADIPANNTEEDAELERLMEEADKMESRLGEGNIVDNPYKKSKLEPAPDNRSDWEKFKDKHGYWFDKSKGGYSAGTNRAQEVGQLMTEMFSPSHWGIRGDVAKLRNTASIAEGKAMNLAQTARNKQKEAALKRLWDEASRNPKNFALMMKGYLPDDSSWWQLWGGMDDDDKESYAMALAIKANEIQQDYLTKNGELANMESLMAAAIKRTPKPTT